MYTLLSLLILEKIRHCLNVFFWPILIAQKTIMKAHKNLDPKPGLRIWIQTLKKQDPE